MHLRFVHMRAACSSCLRAISSGWCTAYRLPGGAHMQPGSAKASDNLQSLDVDVQLLIFGSVLPTWLSCTAEQPHCISEMLARPECN